MKIRSGFRPPWWLRSAHLQTLWPFLFRRHPQPTMQRERMELPDGDFLDLDWAPGGSSATVLVLHGLEGSVRSPYARGILHTIQQLGWRAVLLHFRGCSGEPNRLPRSYHSGETTDLDRVVATLRERFPGEGLAVIGYSLGGNVLLKWLGEQGTRAPVEAGVAVSVPFKLDLCSDRIHKGFSRMYEWHLLRSLRRNLTRKCNHVPCPVDFGDVGQLRSFRTFDDRVTGPLHGFSGADDYYRRSSSRSFLRSIEAPTLIIHAHDDPFMTPGVIPNEEELSSSTVLEVSNHGGHVGFVDGTVPWKPKYWLEPRIAEYLKEHLA